MPLLQPFLLLVLLLAQPDFCFTRQNVSNKKCSEREIFTNLSRSDSYYLIVKEKSTSVAALSGEYYFLADEDKMVEYQSKCTQWNFL